MTDSGAAYAFFAAAEFSVVVTVACLVQLYAAKEVKPEERLMIGFAWLVCLSIVAVIPVDVHTALMSSQPPLLAPIWRILYWATFALTWLVLPIHMGYVDAGDFTAWKKLRNSLSFNLSFYVILGVVCVLGVIFVATLGRIHVTTVVHVSIAASNTFGLLFGVVLLGYGLVEAPRSLWRNSSPQRRLDNYHVRIGQTHSELQEARYRAKKYIMVKADISAQLPRRDELHVYLDKIECKFARQLPDASILNNIVVNGDEVDEATLNVEFDEDGLAVLRRKLRNAVSRMKRLEGKMDMLIRDGLRVSDFVGDREALRQRHQRGDGSGSSMLQYTIFQVRKFCSNEGLRRSIAVGMGIVSASIVFSETTIATRLSNLSVFSLMIRSTAVESGSGAGGLMDIAAYFNMLLVLIPIAYMCFCSYFSLFKLRMFTFYSLSLRHTDAYSLILNASLACRFAAPLCYNYLFMIHIAGSQTSFGRLMGSQIDNVPFFGANFNEYFPVVVLVYTATIYFKVFHRLFRLLGLGAAFDGGADGDDDDSTDGDDDDTVVMKSNRETTREIGRQILRRHGSSVSLEGTMDMPKDTSSLLLGSSYAYEEDEEEDVDIGLNVSNDEGDLSPSDAYDEDVNRRGGGGSGRQKKPLLPTYHSGGGKKTGASSPTDRRFAEMKEKLRSKVESTARR